MNCKPGDLAIVVGYFNDPTVIGRIYRCVELRYAEHRGIHFWTTDPPQPAPYLGIADKHLRLIRDNDGEDETLQWAPVPVKEAA